MILEIWILLWIERGLPRCRSPGGCTSNNRFGALDAQRSFKFIHNNLFLLILISVLYFIPASIRFSAGNFKAILDMFED